MLENYEAQTPKQLFTGPITKINQPTIQPEVIIDTRVISQSFVDKAQLIKNILNTFKG